MNSNDSLCFLALSLTIEQRPVRTDSPSSFFGLQAQRVVSDCRTRNGLCADTGDTTSRHEQQRVTAQSCALISATQQVCTSRSAPLNLARAEHPRPDSVSKGLSKSVDGGAYPNGWRLAVEPIGGSHVRPWRGLRILLLEPHRTLRPDSAPRAGRETHRRGSTARRQPYDKLHRLVRLDRPLPTRL